MNKEGFEIYADRLDLKGRRVLCLLYYGAAVVKLGDPAIPAHALSGFGAKWQLLEINDSGPVNLEDWM